VFCDTKTSRGRGASTAFSYLRPAKSRSNLHVETSALTQRILELIEFDYPNLSEQPGPARHFTIGFSAQQIGDVFPEAVTDPPDTDPELGLQHALNLELTPIIAATVRAIQQLTARVEALEGGSA
jgi:hypothetical protein